GGGVRGDRHARHGRRAHGGRGRHGHGGLGASGRGRVAVGRDGAERGRRGLRRRGGGRRLGGLVLLRLGLLGAGGEDLELARAVAVDGDALAAGLERQAVGVVYVVDGGGVRQVDRLRDRVRDLLAAVERPLDRGLHAHVVGRRDVVRADQDAPHGLGDEVEALHRAV